MAVRGTGYPRAGTWRYLFLWPASVAGLTPCLAPIASFPLGRGGPGCWPAYRGDTAGERNAVIGGVAAPETRDRFGFGWRPGVPWGADREGSGRVLCVSGAGSARRKAYRRLRIGVTIQDLTPDLAEALALGVEHGAIVSRVESGSPAEGAGLQAGDVIVAVNRRRVRNAGELAAASEQAGSVLALNVVRGNARLFIVIR